jgi:hypothetical protein
MSMLDLTRNKLESYEALTPKLNDITKRVVDAIAYPTVHPSMKATIAISHLMLFASQFRRSVELWDSTIVPINSIAFIICDSGAGKDSSHRAAKRCFTAGYELINKELEVRARRRAIQRADKAGEELPNEPDIFQKYLDPIPPIETSVTTGPGLIKLLNDMDNHELGANSLFSGEFGDELSYNQDMTENIKILSELYDLGMKEVTYTKGQEFRSKEINGQAMSALLIGSPTYILYDEPTKRKFQIAFMSKLARRSWFCYTPDKIPEKDFSDEVDPIKAMISEKEKTEAIAKQSRYMMKDTILSISNYHLKHLGESVKVEAEVFELFEVYKRYNSELADSTSNKDSTSALIRRHLQWKALKLAGAFAVMSMSETVSATHYIEAIQFCELLKDDMKVFEYDLNKSYYERFSDYVRMLVTTDGKAIIDAHDIKKHGFLSSITKQRLQEMVTLSAGYDKDGIYKVIGDGTAIQYEPIVRTDEVNISFKEIDMKELNKALESSDKELIRKAKDNISMTTASGYEAASTTFDELRNLLEGDFVYSPFKFNGGIRGKNNIIGGTKWIVLDVDDSLLTASEVHFMLSDINHHIALSSDPNNEYKFRVLLELDAIVELSPVAWKHFCLLIANDLAIKADPLPQSQIFFSYANRTVYSGLEVEPLAVRDYVMKAVELEQKKENRSNSLTTPAKKALLADPLTSFNFLFEAANGEGSRSMIRAAYYAKDLGANMDEIIQILTDANEYWDSPMLQYRFDKIIEQVKRI